MSERDYYGFDTLSLHAGAAPDRETGARATPIYLSTAFVFRDSDHAAALFNMEQSGHVYSRISNPTVAVLEERRSEEHTSELQSRENLVCRLLLEKKKHDRQPQ